jgi:acetolactate synthase regulatory subunit
MRHSDTSDSVRINISVKTDQDHDRLHSRHGKVVDVTSDDAGL